MKAAAAAAASVSLSPRLGLHLDLSISAGTQSFERPFSTFRPSPSQSSSSSPSFPHNVRPTSDVAEVGGEVRREHARNFARDPNPDCFLARCWSCYVIHAESIKSKNMGSEDSRRRTQRHCDKLVHLIGLLIESYDWLYLQYVLALA